MKLATPEINKRTAAFTLAEVLAALMFMAVVIPVVVAAFQVSVRAGEVAARKSAAARVASNIINENIINTNYAVSSQTGIEKEGTMEFPWKLTTETWPKDRMELVTAEVTFTVQGQEHSVKLSTLTKSPSQVSLNGVQP
jgi:type II secretory pathway pseudopilin PulG